MSINVVSAGIVFIAGISIIYKIYNHKKLKPGNRKDQPSFYFPKVSNVAYFFPISKAGQSKDDLLLIKRANRALLVFYLCLVTVCIIAIVYFAFYHKFPVKK